jgi:hypothetical protein
MNYRTTLALSAMTLLYATSSAAVAQNAPPSYQADPGVYKVTFEDQNFRVIEAVRKKGMHDKVHSHLVPSVRYNVTDCVSRLYAPDGKTTDVTDKAGTAMAGTVIASHSVENVGPADCHQIFVERK